MFDVRKQIFKGTMKKTLTAVLQPGQNPSFGFLYSSFARNRAGALLKQKI